MEAIAWWVKARWRWLSLRESKGLQVYTSIRDLASLYRYVLSPGYIA